MKRTPLIILALVMVVQCVLLARQADNSLPGAQELTFLAGLAGLEAARTDTGDAPAGARWMLRSRHFVFGMPSTCR